MLQAEDVLDDMLLDDNEGVWLERYDFLSRIGDFTFEGPKVTYVLFNKNAYNVIFDSSIPEIEVAINQLKAMITRILSVCTIAVAAEVRRLS